jgi:hypothetical protein
MSRPRKKRSADEYRDALRQLQKSRTKTQLEFTKDRQSYSLEGLRLVGLLRQVQSLQALQGLAELRPREKGAKLRFEFSKDRKERGAHRQWLLFKADWLEALLEDTVDELSALDAFEARHKGEDDGDKKGGGTPE